MSPHGEDVDDSETSDSFTEEPSASGTARPGDGGEFTRWDENTDENGNKVYTPVYTAVEGTPAVGGSLAKLGIVLALIFLIVGGFAIWRIHHYRKYGE